MIINLPSNIQLPLTEKDKIVAGKLFAQDNFEMQQLQERGVGNESC